jgi:D-serine deaminase-like pyridoxal phosphate-dependent protein
MWMYKDKLDTPVALVDLDVMERNISDMVFSAKNMNVGLRPHIKTHKVPEITKQQIEAGAVGITCAKLGEAEIMADTVGAKDIFIANLLVGAEKIRRLMNLAERLRISVGVDSVEVAEPISEAAKRRKLKIPVIIKVDTGLERTGVAHGDPALVLAKKIAKMQGLELEGIYTHEGHVYGSSGTEHLYRLSREAGQRMVETAKLIRAAGIDIKTVSVGSTPSARITPRVPGITEFRPGTYVFNDNYQIRLGIAREEDCAFTVLATVISVPSTNRAVIDAGTKCLTSEKSEAFGVYGLVKGMPQVSLVRAYEEHGVLKINPADGKFKVGDKVEIIPNHVCPAVNLFDELVGTRNGIVTVRWNVTARGKVR